MPKFIALLLATTAVLFLTPAMAESLYVIEHAVTDATAPVGKAKDNRGDILTFANPIFESANKKQIGTDNGFCIRTVVGKAYNCSWTTTLSDGQIMVEGPFADAGDTTLAVVGGTGKYAGAKGAMLLHARDAKASQYDFKFSLTN